MAFLERVNADQHRRLQAKATARAAAPRGRNATASARLSSDQRAAKGEAASGDHPRPSLESGPGDPADSTGAFSSALTAPSAASGGGSGVFGGGGGGSGNGGLVSLFCLDDDTLRHVLAFGGAAVVERLSATARQLTGLCGEERLWRGLFLAAGFEVRQGAPDEAGNGAGLGAAAAGADSWHGRFVARHRAERNWRRGQAQVSWHAVSGAAVVASEEKSQVDWGPAATKPCS